MQRRTKAVVMVVVTQHGVPRRLWREAYGEMQHEAAA